jgi:PAS domain S-box-containing protein
MSARIKQLFSPPVFGDEERTHIARSVHIIALTSLIAMFAAALIMLIVNQPIIADVLLVGAGVMVIVVGLNCRGQLQTAITLSLLSALGVVTGVLYTGQGVHDVGVMVYPVVIVVASLLLKPRGLVFIAALSILSVGFVTLSELNGLVRLALPGATGWDDFASLAAILIVTAVVGWFIADDLRRSLARTRHELAERTRTEEALRRTQLAVDQARDAIHWVGADGKLFYVNDATCRALGYTRDELLSMTIFDIDPVYTQEMLAREWEWAREVRNYVIETKHKTKDGRIFPVEVVISHVSYAGQEYHCAYARDITERRLMEETLRRSEAGLAEAQRISHFGSWTWDLATEALHFSDEMFRIVGRLPQAAEVTRTEFLRFLHPDDVEWTLREFQRGVTDDPSAGIEHRVIRPNGEIRQVYSRAKAYYDEKGNLLRLLGSTQDITERKQAEEALRRAEEKYRSIVENAVEGIFQSTPDGRFLSVNPAMARMYGYDSPDDMVQSAADITQQEYADPKQRTRLQYRLETEDVVQGFEMQDRRRDGSTFWTSMNVRAVRDEHDTTLYYEGTLENITARKQAEESLRQVNATLQALIDHAPLAIIMLDPNSQVLLWNEAAERMYGWTADEILGKFLPNIPDDKLEEHRAIRARVLNGESITNLEVERQRKDGSRIHIGLSIAPLKDSTGKIYAQMSIGVDVTEHKRAEETLQMFQYTIDRASDAVQWLNREGGFEYVNDQACRSLGYTREELLRLHLWDIDLIYPKERWDKNWEEYQAGRRGGGESVETLHRRKDGGVFPVEVSSNHLWFGDKELHVAVARDITERRRAAMERETLIRELESKNAELERFVYTVSHDLKSPLITIRGFLGLLEQDVTSGDLARMKVDMARIVEAANRMQRLLEELLELSRIGRMMNPPEDVSFDDIAHDAVRLVEGRLSQRGVQVDIMPDLPRVQGDRARLAEVVQNLLDNAAKFMGEQPSPRVEIGVREEDGVRVFFVRDNGIGIAPRFHERVFGLFNKLDTQSEGTGIGLALVKRIVEVHGGRIWIESDGLGHGATFYFTLPIKDKVS